MYRKQELTEQLRAMGLHGDETILIHSSMKAIGQVEGGADAVLAASLFHFREIEICDLKKYLTDNGVPMRLDC